MAAPALARRVVEISDRQQVHIDQRRRFRRLKRAIRTIAVMVVGLITLEAVGVDSCFTTTAGLLRQNAEQAA